MLGMCTTNHIFRIRTTQRPYGTNFVLQLGKRKLWQLINFLGQLRLFLHPAVPMFDTSLSALGSKILRLALLVEKTIRFQIWRREPSPFLLIFASGTWSRGKAHDGVLPISIFNLTMAHKTPTLPPNWCRPSTSETSDCPWEQTKSKKRKRLLRIFPFPYYQRSGLHKSL